MATVRRCFFIPFSVLASLSFLSALCVPARGALAAPPSDWTRYSVLTPPGPEEPSPEVMREIDRLIYAVHRVDRSELDAVKVAKKYGTDLKSLRTTNGGELLYLRAGTKIRVFNKQGFLYNVHRRHETLRDIAARFYRNPAQIRSFEERIAEANGLPGAALLENHVLEPGTRLLLPGIAFRFDTYRFPVKSYGWPRISSRFGMRYHPILHRKRFHDGVDIPKPWGTPVFPSRTGTIEYAGWKNGYGNLVVIKHSDGASTWYGHLSRIYAKIGEIVKRGKTMIGRVGSTGLSTGPHLHFEVHNRFGRLLNPISKIGRR